jgi:hypothetical protein
MVVALAWQVQLRRAWDAAPALSGPPWPSGLPRHGSDAMIDRRMPATVAEDEIFAAWREAAMLALERAVLMIEALGSVQAVERSGWFESQPPLLHEQVLHRVPVSRGGECTDPGRVIVYERLAKLTDTVHGREALDPMRREHEQQAVAPPAGETAPGNGAQA